MQKPKALYKLWVKLVLHSSRNLKPLSYRIMSKFHAYRVELKNGAFYEEVQLDPSSEVKKENDILVQKMIENDEISDKVGEFLMSGGDKLSKFYHLLKTHNIPTHVDNPSQWLQENGFLIRGIISGRGSPKER